MGGLGGRLTQASGSVLGSLGFGVGLSLAGEEGFFPIFGVILPRVGRLLGSSNRCRVV